MKQSKIVTKESLNAMLRHPDRNRVKKVIGRALVRIHERQTPQEQNIDCTIVQNGIGFAACDAYWGSKHAKGFLANGTLSDRAFYHWLKRDRRGTPRISKYHRQLNEVAVELANRNA